MSQFRRGLVIAVVTALAMSVVGVAVGLSSASPLASAAKKHHSNRGPRGPRGARGPAGAPGLAGVRGATGAAGATGPAGPAGPAGTAGAAGSAGPAGATGPAGPSTVHFINVKTAVQASPLTTHIATFDGLSLDAVCNDGALPAGTCNLYAESTSGTADAITWQEFTSIFPATGGSQEQLGQYVTDTPSGITTAGANGVNMVQADSSHVGQITFSYSTQAGQAVTGTLSVMVGAVYDGAAADSTGYITGTIEAS
jgi:hypothetical protein